MPICKLFERSLFYTRVRNDQNQIVLWSNNGSESMYLYTIPVLPIDPQSSFGGAAYAQWYASNGATGIKPTDPELLKGFELLRGAVSQPEEKPTADRAGNLEAAGGPGVVHRHGWPVTGLYGHAGRQRAAGERAGAHLRFAALPDAVQRPSGAMVLPIMRLPEQVLPKGKHFRLEQFTVARTASDLRAFSSIAGLQCIDHQIAIVEAGIGNVPVGWMKAPSSATYAVGAAGETEASVTLAIAVPRSKLWCAPATSRIVTSPPARRIA